MPATLTRADRRAAKRAAKHANRRREMNRLAGEVDLLDLPINRRAIDPFDLEKQVLANFEELQADRSACRSGLALSKNDASPNPAGQALPYAIDPFAERLKIVKQFEEIERQAIRRKSKEGGFPLHALPPALADWVEGMTMQTRTAPETAAMLALAVSSAALARNTSVEPITGWDEPMNLYVGVLTKLGDQSDTVLHAAVDPLREIELTEQADHVEVAAKDRVYLQTMRRHHNCQERIAEKNGDDEASEKIDASRVFVESFQPTPAPRRILNEVNARSLHYHLAEVDRIACFSPRGEVFTQLAGRNNASRERLVGLLEDCHEGIDFTAQLTRGKTFVVASPSVTIASLVEPSLVGEIAKQRKCPSRKLLSSFVFIEPANAISSRKVSRPMRPEVSQAYADGIKRLAARRPGKLNVAPEAGVLCYQWSLDIDEQVASGPLAPIGLWAKKLPGLTLRLAGILHAWESDSSIISLDTLTSAIEIARWLAPQALSALAQLGAADDDCLDLESAVLRFARSTKEFSPREAMQHLRRTITRRSTLRTILRALVDRGHLLVAKEGTRFPRRFSLANRTVSLAMPKLPDEFATCTRPEDGDSPVADKKAG